MAREYIESEDLLNTGRKKLNKVIDISYDAKDTSDQALKDANKLGNEAKHTSNIALIQSTQADLKSEQTQKLLEDIILESGTSDAEVVQARGDESTLNSRFELNEDMVVPIANSKTNYSGPIITIIDDDAELDFRTVWNPILNDFPDVKIGVAVIKSYTLNGRGLPLEELLELQNNGHDLISHTTNHVASYEITPEEADKDYRESQNWMKKNGMKAADYLVYPGGLSPNFVDIKNVARKYFRYAVSTEAAGDIATSPVDNWCVARANGDKRSLLEMKKLADSIKNTNDWLLIMTHSHILKSSGSQKMRDFIEYTQNIGIPIMKFTDAVKIKGNAIAIGEKTDKKSLFVGLDGSQHTIKDKKYLMETPLNEYESEHTTVMLNYLEDTFLKKGGTMQVFKTEDLSYGYSTFKPINKDVTFTRTWNNSTKTWGEFKFSSGVDFVELSASENIDVSIDKFLPNSISITKINGSKDTIFNVGGLLITYRSNDATYDYQEYITIQNKHFVRKWGNGAWQAFKIQNSLVFDSERDDTYLSKKIDEFDRDSVVRIPIKQSDNTPTKTAGLYTVYSLNARAYSYSEWRPIAGNSLYRRVWSVSGGIWGEWQKVSSI